MDTIWASFWQLINWSNLGILKHSFGNLNTTLLGSHQWNYGWWCHHRGKIWSFSRSQYFWWMQFEPFWPFCNRIYTLSLEFWVMDQKWKYDIFPRAYMIGNILRGELARSDWFVYERSISKKLDCWHFILDSDSTALT